MVRIRPLLAPALLALFVTRVLHGQGLSADTTAPRLIREEGLRRSHVLETALALSDLSPPRLAGSPGYLHAANWAVDRLHKWGIPTARLEPWGKATPSWVVDRYQLEMQSPWYLHLTAFPRAWSPATTGEVRAGVIVVHAAADSDLVALHGRLRGKIVLNGALRPLQPPESSVVHRFTEPELDSLVRLTDPGEPRTAAGDIEPWIATLAWHRRWSAFLRAEGAVGLIEPSDADVLLRADGWEAYPGAHWRGVPSFVLMRPEFNRLLRLVDAGQPVRLALSLAAHLVPGRGEGMNVIAELPGADPALAAEVVMLGGHLDSWISGSGATDNAAGCAVVMEVLRIFRALHLQPRRTVRLALWDAEEPSEDYAGSMGYVKRHFGDWKSGVRLPEHAGLSAYFNLDNGSGRIRGIYRSPISAPIMSRSAAPVRPTMSRSGRSACRDSSSSRTRWTTTVAPITPASTPATTCARTTCARPPWSWRLWCIRWRCGTDSCRGRRHERHPAGGSGGE
jgi:carboxypeptidase Q